jgi:hypothetical protein
MTESTLGLTSAMEADVELGEKTMACLMQQHQLAFSSLLFLLFWSLWCCSATTVPLALLSAFAAFAENYETIA